MIIAIAGQYKPRGMIAHFSKQKLYGLWVQSAKDNLVSFKVLDNNNIIQIQMNNQGFNVEQINGYIYTCRE